MMRIFILLLILLSALNTSAQDESAMNMISRVSPDGTIPEDIRSSKSLLLISCDPGVACDAWEDMAVEAQPLLAESGIDAVATYFFEDVLSGVEPFRAFMSEFDDRGISHLVILRHTKEGYTILLTTFDDKEFIKDGQSGWETTSPELRQALNNMYRAVSSSGQKLRNLLILSVPEYGEMVDIFPARRAEFYDLNFASDKLAVYPFADTARIREVMSAYPYEYEIIDPSIPEKELRSEGFDFVLYYVHTRAENTKRLLGYEVNDKETSYISESIRDGKPIAQSLNKNTSVYKFYIKQVYSGNIFLGKKWDASQEWEQALSNYIALLRNELIRD